MTAPTINDAIQQIALRILPFQSWDERQAIVDDVFKGTTLLAKEVANRLYDAERERDGLKEQLEVAKRQWTEENKSNQATIQHFKSACERLNGEISRVEAASQAAYDLPLTEGQFDAEMRKRYSVELKRMSNESLQRTSEIASLHAGMRQRQIQINSLESCVKIIQTHLQSSENGRLAACNELAKVGGKLDIAMSQLKQINATASNLLGLSIGLKASIIGLRQYYGPAIEPEAQKRAPQWEDFQGQPKAANVGLGVAHPVMPSKVDMGIWDAEWDAGQSEAAETTGVEAGEALAAMTTQKDGTVDVGPDALGVFGIYKPGMKAVLCNGKIRWSEVP